MQNIVHGKFLENIVTINNLHFQLITSYIHVCTNEIFDILQMRIKRLRLRTDCNKENGKSF